MVTAVIERYDICYGVFPSQGLLDNSRARPSFSYYSNGRLREVLASGERQLRKGDRINTNAFTVVELR